MNWNRAKAAMARGKRVRRPHWYTALYRIGDVVLWDITDTLARKCNDDGGPDRSYQVATVDAVADDWVVA